MRYLLICNECFEEFTSNRKDAKCCSVKCNKRKQRKLKKKVSNFSFDLPVNNNRLIYEAKSKFYSPLILDCECVDNIDFYLNVIDNFSKRENNLDISKAIDGQTLKEKNNFLFDSFLKLHEVNS